MSIHTKFSVFLSLLFLLVGTGRMNAGDFQAGSGTKDSPFRIASAQQLDQLRKYTGPSNEHLYFELAADIDLTSFLAGKPEGWEPIGRIAGNGFYGKLDGKDHTIRGLHIDSNDSINVGLFGYVSKSAVIRNLSLLTDERGVTVNFSQAGILAGIVDDVGSSVGEIAYCSVSGKISDAGNHANVGGLIGVNKGYVHHCRAENIVVNTYMQTGGLIGNHYPIHALHDCSVSGEMNIRWSNSGGLIGRDMVVSNPKDIYRCHTEVVMNNPDRGYMGGFIGQHVAENTIYDCYAIATINGNHAEIGGFVGRNSGQSSGAGAFYNGGVIRNCWALATVKGTQYVGGFVGRNYKRIVHCYAIATIEASIGYSGGFVGINYNRVDSCHFTGYMSWAGAGAVGGFLGRNYNEASTNGGGTIAHSYCASHVTKLTGATDTYIGKFFGGQTTPTGSGAVVNGKAIWDCYYDLAVSGYPGTQGAVPDGNAGASTTALSAAAMKNAASFPALDFSNNTWNIWTGKTAPFFSWQTTPMYISRITDTGIVAESKESLSVSDRFCLYANGRRVDLLNVEASGTEWTATFPMGTIGDGSVLLLVRETAGKAPSAAIAKYETGLDGFVDAQDLTVIGQAEPLPNYHRIAVDQYPDLSSGVKNLLMNGAGIGIMFKTNSPKLQVRWTTGLTSNRAYVNQILEKGMDLYIKQDDRWVWAGVARKSSSATTTATLVENMDLSEKECILYLPIYEEVTDLKIGVEPGSTIAPIPSPFRGKVVMYGTSIMQGASASRPGMAYPARLSRATGINFINLGLSGNGTMPKADADMIAGLDADAYVMDCTQNGSVSTIQSNTAYMVRAIRALHPEAPIIMKAGEKRLAGNFDETRRTYWANVYAAFKAEYEKLVSGENPVTNLYFIDDTGFYGDDYEAVADGVHPTDVGFTRMLRILQPKFMEILSELPVFK